MELKFYQKRVLDDLQEYLDGLQMYPNPAKAFSEFWLVVLHSGRILALESKGDHLDNSDSTQKLKLGKLWADKAGDKFRYLMVFKNQEISGSFSISGVKDIIKNL